MKTLGVISSRGGTGKSFLSLNLAAELSRQNQNVLLIEADFTAPNLSYLLDLDHEDQVTWNDYLLNTIDTDQLGLEYEIDAVTSVDVIPTKIDDQEIIDILNSPDKWREFSDRIVTYLSELRKNGQYDYVIFDNQSGRFLSAITHSFFSDLLLTLTRPAISNVRDTLKYMELFQNDFYLVWNLVLRRKQIHEYIDKWEQKFSTFDGFLGSLERIPNDEDAAYQSWVENKPLVHNTEYNRHISLIVSELLQDEE